MKNWLKCWGGHSQHKVIYGCHTCVKIAIYVLKTKFSILFCTRLQHSLEPTQMLSKRPQFYRGQLANFFIIFFAHSFVNGIVYGYIGVMTFLDSCVVTFQDGILKGETILMIYPLDQLKLKTKTKIFFAGVNENSMTFLYTLNRRDKKTEG